jgi:hypothetical protein
MNLSKEDIQTIIESINNSQRFLLSMTEKCDCKKYITQIEKQDKIKQKLYGLQKIK